MKDNKGDAQKKDEENGVEDEDVSVVEEGEKLRVVGQ